MRFFRLLLLAFPRGFRAVFGAGLLETVRRDWDGARSRSPLAAVWFGLTTSVDLVISGLAERLDPEWIDPNEFRDDGRWEMGWLAETWTKDLTHAARSLLRAPGFTFVTAVTLALAIGSNTAIFSVVDAVLLDPLPYADADRIVHIRASSPGSDFPERFNVSAEFYFQYDEGSELLEEVALYRQFGATLATEDRAERVFMGDVSPSFFAMVGAEPVLGRLPVWEDGYGVMVISHGLWTTWFGRDPDVLGKSYHAAGDMRTVIGVMPPDLDLPTERTVLWIPAVPDRASVTPGRFGWGLMGKMGPGVTHADLTTELTQLGRRLPETWGGSEGYARLMANHVAVVTSLEEELVGEVSGALWVLLGTVGVVLLIACANVANLFMVRAESRRQDLAVRRALGAGRGRLVRSQMAEALVLAFLGGALGIAIAWVATPALLALAPDGIHRVGEAGIDPTALGFTLALSGLAALFFGLAPALRFSSPALAGAFGQRGGVGGRRSVTRNALVVVQTASALVLLVGSGLLVRSFLALSEVDPGYDTEDIFTFQIAPEGAALTDGPSYWAFHEEFRARMLALPGVTMAGTVENLPLDEGTTGTRYETEASAAAGEPGPFLRYTYTSGDYFQTMGIELVAGRLLDDRDHRPQPTNALISRAAADLLFPNEDPVGKRFRMINNAGSGEWETVVGVVGDVRQDDFRTPVEPTVYYPFVGPRADSWWVESPAYVLETERGEELTPEVRAVLQEMSPGAPMYRIFTMDFLVQRSMAELRFTMLTLGVASGLALLLGAVGLYGVLSYLVTQRTREIGVRMALGARAREVQRMVVAQGGRVTALGVLVGVAVALALTRLLESFLFGVEALDAPTFVAMSAVMVGVALMASWLPARRASSVDPARSLRVE